MSNPKRSTLWLLAAVAAPAAHFSGCGWFTMAIAALTVLPLTLLPKCWEELPKTVAILEVVWFGTVAGILLKNSAAYWPSDNDLVVPLTLLVLSTITNAAAAPRIGAVLAFCMALLAIPMAVSGAAHVEPGWLKATIAPWPMALTLTLLLPNLPTAGEAHKGRRILAISAMTVLLALLVQGMISAKVAAAVPDAFYQTARTLGYLEPIIAVGITLGWYAMTAYLLQSSIIVAHSAGIGRITASVLGTGTATGFLLFLRQPDITKMTLLSAFLWVLIPFLHKLKVSEKK